MLILVVKLLVERTGLNSKNSSKPPSSDPNRNKVPKKKSSNTAGGQNGHVGSNLSQLPAGQYSECGYESRQVFDIRISRFVTEYRAQVLENAEGGRFVAEFPKEASCGTQYGASVKANAVYMSMFQLIPYERIQTHFAEVFDMPISAGSLYNFNDSAFSRLSLFESICKRQLRESKTLHVDETGVNIGGKRHWLHNASNDQWTFIAPHALRGKTAMDAINILPGFSGVMIHDHWKPYYKYDKCIHSLCNAHHKRELTRAYEMDGQKWALKMEMLLDKINKAVKEAGGCLTQPESKKWRRKYKQLIKDAEIECPPPDPRSDDEKPKGRIARSKSRNLLERLRDYEADVLRFMDNPSAPYTNNQGERDLRMTKVQQKISGCFRAEKGAQIYCLIRSYISTCRKQNVGVGEALECLFDDRWPDFVQQHIDRLGKIAE